MIPLMKSLRALAILGGCTALVMAAPSVRAQSQVSGLLGARQHQPGRLARHLPYAKDDYSALAALRFHDRNGYGQLGLGYAWDPSGRPTAEYVLTPQIHVVFKARYLAFGMGAMKSYVADDEQGDDWSPFYYGASCRTPRVVRLRRSPQGVLHVRLVGSRVGRGFRALTGPGSAVLVHNPSVPACATGLFAVPAGRDAAIRAA